MTGAYPDNDEFSGAANQANQNAGSSGDSNIFSSVLSFLGKNKNDISNEDIDEDDAVNSHKQFFSSNNNDRPSNASTGSMGNAAAMQALKMFMGNNNSGGGNGGNQSGGSQAQLIGLAMAEASKLFDNQASQGKVQQGSTKQSVVEQAGKMALKMYLKGQGGSSGSAGSGPGGLLGMAAKFF
jgi:hypothetical protein